MNQRNIRFIREDYIIRRDFGKAKTMNGHTYTPKT